MSELPEGWASTAFVECSDIKLGKMLDQAKNVGDPTAYLRNINVRWGDFDLSDLAQMRMTASERAALDIRDGDLLVCEGGEPGRSAVWDRGPIGLTFQKALMRVRPMQGVEPRYLAALLRHSSTTGDLDRHLTGTTIKHLPQAALSSVSVPLAPCGEQRRIVAKIDRLSARLKRARNELECIHELRAQFKKQCLAAFFFKALSRAEKTASLGDKSLDVRNGLSKKPNATPPGTPILRISAVRPMSVNVRDTRFYPSDENVNDQDLLRDGDLLFTRYNGNPELTGACGLVSGLASETTYPDKLIRVRTTDDVSAAYVQFIANAPQSRDFLTAHIKSVAGQHGISGKDLKRLPLPIPLLAEQREIVRRIEHAFAAIDRLAAEAQSARALLDKLDQAILAKAFRGELVPQDPNDEPASVLLQRIRAERAAALAKDRKGRGRPVSRPVR